MTKVIINSCFGGFGLSDAAIERYAELKGMNLVKSDDFKNTFDNGSWYVDGIQDNDHYFSSYSLNHSSNRADPFLVQVIEEMGEKANGWASELVIVEVPDDVEWHIAEYDGLEHVAEDHRTWYGD